MKQLLFIILFFAISLAHSKSTHCRCRPHESCWPSHQEWKSLNHSIDGNLVAVRPVAAACHEPDFNKADCDAATASWKNSVWRAAQPGAVQWVNWEAWPEHNESCYVHSSPEIPCGQGRISLYSAIVNSASQIQHAVRFAKKHNIRLVIKNSGHDFLGRSTAPDSLQILTSGMKDIRFSDNFVPAGAHRHKAEGPAVTIGAGVALKELYTAAAEQKRMVVAGSSYTVGAAGGYIQGGGHSPIGAWKGMASDNALEFRVVTANGDLVYANAYKNTDLFWALRGGGGGTFGVVVHVTIRTFPDAPMVFSSLNISSTESTAYWDSVTQFHASLPTLNDAGGTGYYYIRPQFDYDGTDVQVLALALMFPNTTDTTKVDGLFHPLISSLNKTSSLLVQYECAVLPRISSVFSKILIPGPVGTADDTGVTNLIGSRLFSRDLLVSKDGPARLVEALKPLSQGITGHIVAGGAVARNGKSVDSALNPAWRRTITHIAFGYSWGVNATVEEQEAFKDKVTNVDVPSLRSVEGGNQMGAYLNEANAYEADFQTSFWGKNYRRLYRIKQKWDPTGLFITRKGVGSEDWDDAGLCRMKQ